MPKFRIECPVDVVIEDGRIKSVAVDMNWAKEITIAHATRTDLGNKKVDIWCLSNAQGQLMDRIEVPRE